MRLIHTFLKTSAITALTLALTPTAMAQDSFAIINAKVVTNTAQGTQNNLTVLIEDGKIKAIGKTDTSAAAPKPNGKTIIDGTGKWVTPGIFAPMSAIGLVEVGAEASTNDTSADDAANSAGLKASDSFNPKSASIANTRLEGVTHAAISSSPGESIFAGLGAIIDTTGSFTSVLNDAAFMYIRLGEAGARLEGGSRAAALNALRGALDDAQSYPRRFNAGPDNGDYLSRSDAAAMASVVRGQKPLIINVDRASDIKSVLELKTAYPRLNIMILGGAEAWVVADDLAKAKIAVMIDPVESLPYSFSQAGTRQDNALRLKKAGVNIAIMNRDTGFTHQTRLLPQHAGNAVAHGLSWDDAFKAITLTPAQLFGRPELGTLKTGQTANLVIWDGDPLEVMSAPTRVLIGGKSQPMVSRQTALRDRYNPKTDDKRAYKYR